MVPCQAAPALDIDDIDAAESLDNFVEGGAHGGRIGDIAGQTDGLAADFLGDLFRRFAVEIENGDFGTLGGEGFRRGGADARAAAGDNRHLTGQRLFRRLAQLGLFQRPVFDLEHVEFGNALIFADGFGIGDDVNGVFGNVGGDGRILGRGAKAEHADARHQHDARQRIEFFFLLFAFGVVDGEIIVIARDKRVDSGLHVLFPLIQLAGLGRGHQQRPVLGADGVIGRDDADLAVAGDILAAHVIENGGVGAEGQNLALHNAGLRIFFERHGTAQDRRDIGDRCNT